LSTLQTPIGTRQSQKNDINTLSEQYIFTYRPLTNQITFGGQRLTETTEPEILKEQELLDKLNNLDKKTNEKLTELRRLKSKALDHKISKEVKKIETEITELERIRDEINPQITRAKDELDKAIREQIIAKIEAAPKKTEELNEEFKKITEELDAVIYQRKFTQLECSKLKLY
jgi:gas vesicle protein